MLLQLSTHTIIFLDIICSFIPLFFEHIPAIGNPCVGHPFHQSVVLIISAHALMLVQVVYMDSLCTHSE